MQKRLGLGDVVNIGRCTDDGMDESWLRSTAGITDVWIEYTDFKPISFTVGQFRESFGLEYLSTKQPTAKAGEFELQTESPGTRRLNDVS